MTKSCGIGRASWTLAVVVAWGAAGRSAGAATPLNLPFDAAFTVAAAGSTDPVSTFALAGPAPVLFVDLPDGALYSWSSSINSKWFEPATATPAWSIPGGIWGAQDKFWLTPTEAQWEASKATGAWRIDATFSLVDLVMIYGVGAPIEWARGSAQASFTVVDAPAALPGDFNGDDAVDADDLHDGQGWIARFGDDLAGDDMLAWQQNFGVVRAANAALGASVPEPATAALALLGAASSLRRRPRCGRRILRSRGQRVATQ